MSFLSRQICLKNLLRASFQQLVSCSNPSMKNSVSSTCSPPFRLGCCGLTLVCVFCFPQPAPEDYHFLMFNDFQRQVSGKYNDECLNKLLYQEKVVFIVLKHEDDFIMKGHSFAHLFQAKIASRSHSYTAVLKLLWQFKGHVIKN